jgi:hypothetical protein
MVATFRPWIIAATLGLVAAAPVNSAEAQPRSAASALDLEELKEELESGVTRRVRDALQGVYDAGDTGKPAAPLVDALLRRGASGPLVLQALGVVQKLGVPASSTAAAPYLRHRSADVRYAAVLALGATGGPTAIRALRSGLRSNDSQVRRGCATALGDQNAPEAVADLLAALQHGIGEAAISVGKLCQAPDCGKFAELLGKQPFRLMTAGFDGILFRPKGKLKDEVKLALVKKLQSVGTPEVARYLNGVAQRWPKRGSRKVKRAIEEAVMELSQ